MKEAEVPSMLGNKETDGPFIPALGHHNYSQENLSSKLPPSQNELDRPTLRLSNPLLSSATVGRGEKEAARAPAGEAVDLPRLRWPSRPRM